MFLQGGTNACKLREKLQNAQAVLWFYRAVFTGSDFVVKQKSLMCVAGMPTLIDVRVLCALFNEVVRWLSFPILISALKHQARCSSEGLHGAASYEGPSQIRDSKMARVWADTALQRKLCSVLRASYRLLLSEYLKCVHLWTARARYHRNHFIII